MRFRFRDLVLDTETRLLERRGAEVPLSTKAYELLVLLVEARPRVLSKAELLETLWPRIVASEGTLSVLMAEVRKALGVTAKAGPPIRTVHGVGYAFTGPVFTEDTGRAELTLRFEGHDLPLRPGENVLGRDADCAVRVDRPTVSRHHARILVASDDVTLEDLDSKNGTFLGETRVTEPRALVTGDTIGLGSVRLRYFVRLPEDSTRTEG